MKLGIGERRGAIHGYKHIQLAVFRLHLGNVDMEVAQSGKWRTSVSSPYLLRPPATG
jgi:hypothetical protein